MRLNPRSSHLQWLIYLLTALFLASCATPITERTHRSSIGPFSTFSARLIVIEPAHRWQVLVDWDAPTAAHGTLRLTHAASNTVIEFRWQGRLMYIRDGSSNAWRSITTAQLAEHGIFIHPARLAAILSGQMPADFHAHGQNQWESRRGGNLIRLHWYADNQRLLMSDIAHGRKATLIIQ